MAPLNYKRKEKMDKKKTITRKKKTEGDIVSDLEIPKQEEQKVETETPAQEKQMAFEDSEGLVSRPQLKGERKPVKPTYTQPGTNNQSRTSIKE